MKNKILKTLIVLILAAVTVCLTSVAVNAADEPTRYGATTLSGNAKYVYDKLVQGVNKETPDAEIKFEFSKRVTKAEFEQGVDVFISDHPESFWIRKNYSYTSSGEYVVAITPNYCFSGSELTAARAELDAAVEAIMATVPDGTNYEKALYLHDLLADRVTYLQQGEHQTAYGALVSGKAVCAGYAAAYQLLLREAGIMAWTVTGTSKDPVSGTEIAHAWNVLWLDSTTCVYVDVTWDDQGDRLFHYYFGISKDEMAYDHTVAASKFILPACSHSDESYFDNSELSVDENTTASELAEMFGPSINNKRTAVIRYEGTTPFAQWIEDVCGSVYIKLGGGGYSYSYGYVSMGDEIHLTFSGTFPPMTYLVSVLSGANMTSMGNTAQYVEIGDSMETVIFTAADGYYFPSTYSVTSKNGITVTRHNAKQISVSGIPTRATQIALPAPTAMTKAETPTATLVATGSDSAVLSGLSAGMKYSVGGSVWKAINSPEDITLTDLEPCNIYIVRKGNGEDKLDSDPQIITVTQSATPSVEVTDPTAPGEKGRIETEEIHEYSLDQENWTACAGALEDLGVGTYYIRVKPNGAVLASEPQIAIIHEHDFVRAESIVVPSALTLALGKSETLEITVLPENADDKRVIFMSRDESIVTVDQNGRITALKAGSVVVEVRLVDGDLAVECTVTVVCEHSEKGEWQFDDDRHWRKCSKCGEEIDSAEHSFGEWEIISMPTDTENGMRERYCECGHKEDQHFYIVEEGTEKPTGSGSTYDPGEKDTAVSPATKIACFSSVSAGYLIAVPLICAAIALKRRKED